MKTLNFKKAFVLLFAIGLVSSVVAANYNVDKSKTTVKWLGKKVTGEHYGKIGVKEGNLSVDGSKITGGTVVIDMNSMTDEDLTDATWNEKLIGHLKSDDFFSTAKFPTAQLVVKKVSPQGGNKYKFSGDLTIKGITQPAEFEATVATSGNTVTAEGKLLIDRTKYNVRYGSGKFFENLGDKTIYDEFTLDFKLVATK